MIVMPACRSSRVTASGSLRPESDAGQQARAMRAGREAGHDPRTDRAGKWHLFETSMMAGISCRKAQTGASRVVVIDRALGKISRADLRNHQLVPAEGELRRECQAFACQRARGYSALLRVAEKDQPSQKRHHGEQGNSLDKLLMPGLWRLVSYRRLWLGAPAVKIAVDECHHSIVLVPVKHWKSSPPHGREGKPAGPSFDVCLAPNGSPSAVKRGAVRQCKAQNT